MVRFKTFQYHDNQMFNRAAFSMLIPADWNTRGGIIWRQHATMPGAVDLSLRSSDNLYALSILPSMPYYWGGMNLFGMFGQAFGGGSYMGNESRQPSQNFLQYLQQSVLPKLGVSYRITNAKPFGELEQILRQENPQSYGFTIQVSAGIADFEYMAGGMQFEGSVTCGLVYTNMMNGATSWMADKIFMTQFPKGQRGETSPIFGTILKSFKFDLNWYNMYCQLVQANTQYVMNDIFQAGVRSRIISNMSNQISEMNRHSYERQQASLDRVYRGISESIRGVNSYHDPYKGYDVEFPCDYRYVYANPLGEYVVTNDPNYNPNVGSNLSWTILNG